MKSAKDYSKYEGKTIETFGSVSFIGKNKSLDVSGIEIKLTVVEDRVKLKGIKIKGNQDYNDPKEIVNYLIQEKDYEAPVRIRYIIPKFMLTKK